MSNISKLDHLLAPSLVLYIIRVSKKLAILSMFQTDLLHFLNLFRLPDARDFRRALRFCVRLLFSLFLVGSVNLGKFTSQVVENLLGLLEIEVFLLRVRIVCSPLTIRRYCDHNICWQARVQELCNIY